MLARETCAVAANLREAMEFFGRARPNGEVISTPGSLLIACGLDYPAFNAAILAEPPVFNAADLRRRLQAPARYFTIRRLRWSCWVCDDFLDAGARRDAPCIMAELGLLPLTNPPGLYADALLPPRRALPSIEVRRVEHEHERLAFSHITAVSFEIPELVCRGVYGLAGAWTHSFEGYLAYAHGEAVTATALVLDRDVAGIYSVSTLPHYRRKGYAEATMREVLRLARERSGIEATVLQSTPTGVSLYRQMGYRPCAGFSVYMS